MEDVTLPAEGASSCELAQAHILRLEIVGYVLPPSVVVALAA